jgi:hypothetical protein
MLSDMISDNLINIVHYYLSQEYPKEVSYE